MVNYFFVDGARQQQGPVTAETMKQHLKGGLVAGGRFCGEHSDPIAPIGLT